MRRIQPARQNLHKSVGSELSPAPFQTKESRAKALSRWRSAWRQPSARFWKRCEMREDADGKLRSIREPNADANILVRKDAAEIRLLWRARREVAAFGVDLELSSSLEFVLAIFVKGVAR
jgi:hypothetical protein